MLIYTLVTDRYEDSEYDDSAWLDVALHVHGQLDGRGKAELASTVHGFVLQDALLQRFAGRETAHSAGRRRRTSRGRSGRWS